jgi:hypothetical protein
MAAIPGVIQRGERVRSNTDYKTYSCAAWQWWCARNGCEFALIDQPPDERFAHLPPTFQRWLTPLELVGRYGEDVGIAMVDADTMIRWDAPSPFDFTRGGIAGVLDGNARWIAKSFRAFGHLFPGVQLEWWEAVNAGVVLCKGQHAARFAEFVQFAADRWAEISEICASDDVGTDQPLLNLFLRAAGESVQALPTAFNMLHCVNINPFEAVLAAYSEEEKQLIYSSDSLYDFVDLSWIWHFTNVVTERELVMSETWKRVRSNYAQIATAAVP